MVVVAVIVWGLVAGASAVPACVELAFLGGCLGYVETWCCNGIATSTPCASVLCRWWHRLLWRGPTARSQSY
jgi:hypothetical protein